MFLAQPLLFKSLCYVDGRWVHSDSGATVAVVNPADQTLLGHVPLLEQGQIASAVDAAHRAQRAWRYMPLAQRNALLER